MKNIIILIVAIVTVGALGAMLSSKGCKRRPTNSSPAATITFTNTVTETNMVTETVTNTVTLTNTFAVNVAVVTVTNTINMTVTNVVTKTNVIALTKASHASKASNTKTPTAASKTASAKTPTAGVVPVSVPDTTPKNSFNTNGVVKGVPALFVNRADQTVTAYIKQTAGPCTITLVLKPGERKFNLAPGGYSCTWSIGSYRGSSAFTVDKDPVHYYDGVGATHGGLEFGKED